MEQISAKNTKELSTIIKLINSTKWLQSAIIYGRKNKTVFDRINSFLKFGTKDELTPLLLGSDNLLMFSKKSGEKKIHSVIFKRYYLFKEKNILVLISVRISKNSKGVIDDKQINIEINKSNIKIMNDILNKISNLPYVDVRIINHKDLKYNLTWDDYKKINW